MIILWQNILEHQQVTLNSVLTTLPNRNFYRTDRGSLILYYSKIRKNDENREQRTDRQADRQRIQLQRPLLSPWIVEVSGPIPTVKKITKPNGGGETNHTSLRNHLCVQVLDACSLHPKPARSHCPTLQSSRETHVVHHVGVL